MPAGRNFFQKIPFIRIFCLFLTGILINHLLAIDLRVIAILITILISFLIFLWHNSDFTTLKVQNLLISLSLVFLGVFYPGLKDRPLPSFKEKDYFLAEVCQKPAEKANTFQTILLIQNSQLKRSEKVTAYFNKEKFDSTISTGNQLVILAYPQKIKNSGNPYEIDYQSMMNRNDIYFSVYLNKGTYLKTGNQINRFGLWAELYRDKLISLLTTAIPEKEERSVVSALTLGYRTEIDQETLDYFASTGAMHVLSVSGLHVALIYFILGFLLGFLKRGKFGNAVFTVVMISFLWIYAFITGFSPAVQRATVMFTFVIIGNSLRRQINIYNSLTASAFFLILLNPEVIFDIGFQLSYLAVFGIVLIQPALDRLLELSNPMLKWCWSLFSVSLAAQFITFPLGLFYFNQFPNLFWLSSFVVIPITTLIIWLTLAFFIFSPLHGVSMMLGLIIEKLAYCMLFLLKEMDALPYAVCRGIVLTPIQVSLLFAGIVAIVIYFATKDKLWIFSMLILLILFQTSEIIERAKTIDQNIIIIYNSKNPMIHLINGRNNYLLTKDFSKLSRSEKSTFERVRYHLRLDPAQIISDDNAKSNSIPNDLIINGNEVQFTNCLIRRESINNIELEVYRQENKLEPENYTISLKNLNFGIQLTKGNFQIKEQGAFYCNLNQND